MSFLEKLKGMRRSKSSAVIKDEGGGEEGKALEKGGSNSHSLQKLKTMQDLLNVRRVQRSRAEIKN